MQQRKSGRDRPGASSQGQTQLAAALFAGAVAIGVNTALLLSADAVGLTTARGGLLRLLRDIAGTLAPRINLAGAWNDVLAPTTSAQGFQIGFHLVVGLLMAIFYAFVLEPILPGRPLVKGPIYAVIVWLLNAFAVLPLTGEGIAGSHHLGAPGIIGFALAHTVFFVLLAVLYARQRANP
jgi:hypothetical protein